VRFDGVGKSYYGPRGYRSLRSEIVSSASRVIHPRTPRPLSVPPAPALIDLSFDVESGESFGIVGPNGAGKSTALKIAARISRPTSGRVDVRGRVGALIDVGTGIHPELTGRENIWLYGRILGLSRSDIRSRFDDIVAFSELETVLDETVRTYSSGMQLRLGFATASHLEPDVFVVDEALAVGDARFQARCVERMMLLVREGRTLIFVSHNLSAIEGICGRALFLNAGRVMRVGPTSDVLANYLEWIERLRGQETRVGDEEGDVQLVSATCHASDGRESYEFTSGDALTVRLRFRSSHRVEAPFVTLGITDGRPGLLVQCSMLEDGRAPAAVGTEWECRCHLSELPLKPRLYQVYCEVDSRHGHMTLRKWSQVQMFRVVGPRAPGPLPIAASIDGALDVRYEWEVDSGL
jgi:lipopolysaccharide transport system ATP-binding protein